MDNIFQSKEVYKQFSTVHKHQDTTSYERPSQESEIIKVTGMYVVGVHRVPTYYDPGLMITDIEGTLGELVEYSQKTELLQANATISITDINSSPVSIISYGINVEHIHDDSTIKITDINSTPLDIYEYGIQVCHFSQSATDHDATIEIVDINSTANNIDILLTFVQPVYDSGLRIVQLSTNDPTIINVTN